MLEHLLKRLKPRPAPATTPELLDLTRPDVIARFNQIVTQERADQTVCPLTNGGLLLLDPDDVKAAFTQKGYSNEPSRFSAIAPRHRDRHVAAQVAGNIPPFLDAPRHTTVRKWLVKAMRDALPAFEAQMATEAESHVAAIPAGTPLLLIEDVARGYVTRTISQFTGVSIPEADLKRYTGALFRLFAPIHDAEVFARTNEALAEARGAILRDLATARAGGTPSLLHHMTETLDLLAELALSPEESDLMIADNALLVLADGVENVEAAIAEVMIRWTDLPSSERPEITEGFVRETLHHATPGQTIARIASQEMHLAGQKCPAGSPIFLSLAGANARTTGDTDFSFGLGRHRCIGERLAIAMILGGSRALAGRQPRIDASAARYEPMFGHRWVRDVTVTLT